MFRNYFIPILAVAGVAFAIYTVVSGDRSPPPVPPVSPAPQSPFQTAVAGTGLVEASSENISIGTPIDGIVSKIHVQVGGLVTAGDPLFTLDDRVLRAELAARQAAVQVTAAQLADANYDLAVAEGLVNKGVSPTDDREKKRYVMRIAEAKLRQAQTELDSTATDLDRLIVRAPVDGQVLQLKVHPGEFATASATTTGQTPLILLGNITPLHVRVEVDENDAWQVRNGSAATGFLRGHKEIQTPLKFVRFEPYVVPKKSLTGDSTERVDTRVLQIIFSFTRNDLPLYVGQQMDVFIDATAPTPPPRSLRN